MVFKSLIGIDVFLGRSNYEGFIIVFAVQSASEVGRELPASAYGNSAVLAAIILPCQGYTPTKISQWQRSASSCSGFRIDTSAPPYCDPLQNLNHLTIDLAHMGDVSASVRA